MANMENSRARYFMDYIFALKLVMDWVIHENIIYPRKFQHGVWVS